MAASDDARRLPERWKELDKRTIELIARLNEDERRHLVDLMALDDKEIGRLRRLLSLPDEKWEAGFKIVTRSAFLSAVISRVPRLILLIAGVLVAVSQIWGFLAPYVGRWWK